MDNGFTQRSTLTVDTSSIVDADVKGDIEFTYQWYKDNGAIDNAVGKNYSLDFDDVGNNISVKVRYVDYYGQIQEISKNVEDPITQFNTLPVGNVTTQTTNLNDGDTLVADISAISDVDVMGGINFSYQWYRGNEIIVDATQKNYILQESDFNTNIHVKASFVDFFGYIETLSSTPTDAIEHINRPHVGSLTLKSSGANIGDTLIATPVRLSDPDHPVQSSNVFKWYRDDVFIEGSSGTEYLLTEDDFEKDIHVEVTYQDAFGYFETVKSNISENITFKNNLPEYTITYGDKYFSIGDQITASVDSLIDIDVVGSIDYTYQWYRGDVAIAGATTANYTIKTEDFSDDLYLKLRYIDEHNFEEVVTSKVWTFSQGTELDDSGLGISIGNSIVFGLDGEDWIASGNGKHTVFCGDGDDRLSTAGGNVYIDGGVGDDRLSTTESDGVIIGGSGNDNITFSTGNLVIEGGVGKDYIWGSGPDTKFIFSAGDSIIDFTDSDNLGMDTVRGLSDTGTSKVLIKGGSNIVADGVVDGADSSYLVEGESIKSHSITNGIISFDDEDVYATALYINVSDPKQDELRAALEYLQNQDFGDAGATIIFTASLNTYMFTQGSDDGIDDDLDIAVNYFHHTNPSLNITSVDGVGELLLL